MSVKLQWLAYPCFAFAALALAHAIYIVGITFDEPDFAPALGVFVAIRDMFAAVVVGVLGLLIWLAFRKQEVQSER